MAAAAEILSLILRANLALAGAVIVVALARTPVRYGFGAQAAYRLWLLPVVAALAAMAPARRVGVSAQALTHGGVGQPSSLGMVGLVVWLVGVIVAIAIMAGLQKRFVRAARRGAVGPAVVGIFAPRVVMPADFRTRFTGEEQALILAHERAHLSRHDPGANGLAAVVQCLCWFNPLAHLGGQLMRIDQELACDAAVVADRDADRSAYARALLKAQLAGRALPLGCYWPARSEHPLAARLDMLVRREPDSERKALSSWLLGWSALALSLGVWVAQPPRLELERAGVAIPRGARAPVMTPTGEMTNAVHPDTPSQAQQGAVPLMAPTGETLPAYTPPDTF